MRNPPSFSSRLYCIEGQSHLAPWPKEKCQNETEKEVEIMDNGSMLGLLYTSSTFLVAEQIRPTRRETT